AAARDGPGPPLADPPPGGRVAVSGAAGRTRILLPAPGFDRGVVLLALFGLAFAAAGTGVALAGLGLLGRLALPGLPASPAWPAAALGGAFALIGLVFLAIP